MLAMVVNDNAGCLTPRGVLTCIASMLAPTGEGVCFWSNLHFLNVTSLNKSFVLQAADAKTARTG
ncbi:hypothetical protein DKY63_07980 [Pseudomonas putida]|uniref:Uncharacterized protein n=1 Tax=Pseudomonas putida TaxID=303 RepID=A0A2Z4RFC2_PSEPU|nr:hypothetical protein DKY63_07980 [Pseudomonas putida]